MKRKISVLLCLTLALVMMLSSFTFGLTKAAITKITFEKATITVEEGQTIAPAVTLTPGTALKNQLKWKSSNEPVAKVNFEGTVYALKAGTAVITAYSSTNSKVSADITVTVTAKAAPIEIRIPVFERGRQGQQPADTGYWAKWIQATVLKDLNIKVTYVPIARPNPQGTKDAFNLLIAANNAPDIITEYDQSPGYLGWMGQGVFQDVPMKTIKQYAPNYAKYEGASVLKNGVIEGKQMFLPAKRPIPIDATYVSMIRQDWLDQVGMRNPRTLDEYINVLKAFKEKIKPVNGNAIIPMYMDYAKATNFATDNYIFRPEMYSDKVKYIYSDISTPPLTWQAEKGRLKFLNQLYNDGLISPEFMLDTDGSKARTGFMGGYVGIWNEYLTTDANYISTLMKNVPTAKLSTLYPYSKSEGVMANTYYYTPAVGLMNGINKDCKHVPEVLKFLDWMSKSENLKVLQWGIEGKNYNVVNGKPINASYVGNEQMLNGNNKDYYCLVVEGVDMGSDWDNLQIQACPAGEKYRYLMEDNFKYLRPPFGQAVKNVFIPAVIESTVTYGPTLVAKYKEYACKLITCKPSDFESLYFGYCLNYLESGYQKIIDEKSATYDKWFNK